MHVEQYKFAGYDGVAKKILVLRRRQNTRYKDDSRSEENIETSEVVSTSEPVQDIEASVVAQQEKKEKRS